MRKRGVAAATGRNRSGARALRLPRNVGAQGSFTEREIAILRLLAGGYSNKEIARTLFLAEGTVKNYVSDILEKLEARDRTRRC